MINEPRNQPGEPRTKGLEPIADMLVRKQKKPAGLSTQKTTPNQKTEPGPCECKMCGESFHGEITTYYFVDPPRVISDSECPACREKVESAENEAAEKERRLKVLALRESWIDTCGIPTVFQTIRFRHLDSFYQAKTQNICRKWAESFVVEDPAASRSMMLYSATPGVGKTVLMSCMAAHIIDNWVGDPERSRCPVKFISGPEMVRRVRATYDAPDGQRHERETDVYKELGGVGLLMLDDVGKEQPRSYRFTQEMYWYIIDARVKAGLPVVLNSRRYLTGEDSLEQLMGVDTVDRLYGMTGGQMTEITGKSYRRLKKIP